MSTSSSPSASRAELPSPEEFARVLHARGQRATPQRYAILRELSERRRHATAEEIGRAVRARMPGTSTPTVYATLDLLVGLGLVRRIDTGHGAAVYDAGREPHHHMVCRECGGVTDLAGELDSGRWLAAAGATGFRPEGAELVVSGLCPSCARAG